MKDEIVLKIILATLILGLITLVIYLGITLYKCNKTSEFSSLKLNI
jgi:uncharacterized protein YoxC